ncbi:OLC1v1002580C1 [Oldenlandia corymbosa var. corymbosa]|uniref:OLC1v1002580C1 n=1 Tax=Oldenlandia corymbosa var. corymbosa TaxID=529605 RepID=A0AAV1DAB3_OLDCO|nr:OLC1v1002580C1 [Oldenlandia corymbosa var. corymbosa]
MDSHQNAVFMSPTVEMSKSNFSDTALRLDCFGYGGSKSSVFGGNQTAGHHATTPDDGCRLVLGLGPTPSTYSDKFCQLGTDKKKGVTAIVRQGLSSDGDSLKLGLSAAGSDDNSNVLEYSASVQSNFNTPRQTNRVSPDGRKILVPVVDEGSTSAKKSGGYLTTFFIGPKIDNSKMVAQTEEQSELDTNSLCHRSQLSSEPSIVSDYSRSTISGSTTSADHRTSNPKRCKFIGCAKGARGATGFCIGHGGGQRCQKLGCSKGAESRTAFCKAHGGGRRCQELGCTKSAEGKTDLCIAHGGGRRCSYEGGCTKAARGKSGLCIRHGGGKRCKVEGCTRSAEGQIGLCISHGGGRRCQFPGCTKGAQGSTSLCKAHGGGKRCIFAGCTKGAEGSTPLCKGHGGGKRCLFDGGGICPKSVHGGTNFCVAHGGGKRCSVAGCTKSARGRTDCCVRHGGGKRCKVENCGKSAQGSTDFCKAHGGGKRCSYGGGKCEKFARGKSGLCAAHTSLVQGQETSKGSMIGPGLFHGLVSAASTARSNVERSYSSCGASMMSGSTGSPIERPAKRQQLIPPQVLVPLSMKASSSHQVPSCSEKEAERNPGFRIPTGSSNAGKGLNLVLTEGRVHGGGLMSLLGGNLRNATINEL